MPKPNNCFIDAPPTISSKCGLVAKETTIYNIIVVKTLVNI